MTKKDYYTKEVFKLFDEIDYYFGANFTIDDVSILNGLINDVYPEYEVSTGASKCVIIPNDKNYIIKIPFTGEGSDEIYENDSEYYDYCQEYGIDYSECPYDRWVFENASNSQNGWDYCLKEAEVYKAAEDAGLEKYFAKTVYIGDYCNHPLYIQEKCCSIYESDTCETKIKKYNEKYKLHIREYIIDKFYEEALDWHTTRDWFLCLFNYLKEKKGLTKTYKELEKLADFLDEEYVRDLHSGNTGLIAKNSMPVMMDYSSFED